jgi:hypothetical protein
MTAQFGEILRYRDEDVSLCTEPLGSYFAMGGHNPGFQKISTALHRGYVGSWEIVEGRLYLVKIEATLMSFREAHLEDVFPGFGDRVFAHWYSGTLRVPRGKLLRYVHGGWGSVYARDEMMQIERGVVRGSWVRHNSPED